MIPSRNESVTSRNLFAARRRHHRRVWAGNGRAHVEVRGLEQPGADHFAAAVRARLERLDGVSWVCVPGPLGRVVAASDTGTLDTDALVHALAEVEEAHGAGRQPFAGGDPEHPGDLQPLQRELAALTADFCALGFTVVGRIAQLTPVPVELISLGTMIDAFPRLRSLLARLLGWPVTEVTLATANAVSAALAHGGFGLIVDIAHRSGQLAERRARRVAWMEREAQLCAVPAQLVPLRVRGKRPVPLPPGPIERASDRLMVASWGAAGALALATSSPHRAGRLLLSGLPRAARLGREAFAAQLGRALAARGVLVLDPEVLRRLDRINTVIVDAGVMLTGRSTLDEFTVLADHGAQRLRRHAHALFDPDDPQGLRWSRRWRLGPLDQLGIAADAEYAAPIRHLSAGGRRVLGITRDELLVGLVAVAPEIDPEAEALVREVRRAGHRLLIAGPGESVPRAIEPDGVVPGGTRLAGEVRRLQHEGKVVAVVSSGNSAALEAADCGIGITQGSRPAPWDADVLCTDRLQEASFLVQATTAASEVSRRSAMLAVGGSMLGGLFALAPGHRAGHRALILVNGAALTSVATGAWAGLNLFWQPMQSPVPVTPWHALPGEAVLRALGSGVDGLSEEEAQRRLAAHGNAEANGSAPPGLGRAVLAELETPLTPVLAAGAGLSAAAGGLVDAAMVAAVLGVNALVGGVQRVQTDRTLADLLERVRIPVRVWRDGGEREISSEDLAPGDLVRLRDGDAVPADCRVLDPIALEVDESSLTGESFPVRKRAKATPAKAVADRRSMLYEGTTIVAGEATAVVVATGASTEAGQALAGAQGASSSGVEQRLSSLTKKTIPMSLAGGVAVATVGALRRRPVRELLGSGVGLAVAAVPEGLPILATVAQLAAARRLSTHGALVRNPRTIEALGRVDVLCIDKTGTLTEGKIRLRRVADLSHDEPLEALTGARIVVLAAALRASPQDNGQALSHATDRAVVRGAAEAAVTAAADGRGWERVADLPFEPARGFHAAINRNGAATVLSVKGAPEVVLPRCVTRRSAAGASGAAPLCEDDRRQLDAQVERLARRGFRVLVVAERPWEAGSSLREADITDLELRGLLALADPVRPTALQALAEIRDAGVAVAMITGDHPSTARAVASELDMLNGGRVLTGADLDAMDDAELDANLADVTVYARVTPAHKVRIVQALQRTGRTVAMTGDGANDAPAIRLADVGVAVGGASAIPAARSAADVVIADDRVETLIDTLVEGRAMWASVRDALSILLGGNLGEICYGVVGSLMSRTPVMTTRQLLLVNLLTDMAPATVIALRPPRNLSPAALLREGPEASLGSTLNREVWIRAVTTAGGATGAWLAARATGRPARARTVGLVALVGTQLGQTMATGGHSPLVLVTGAASFAVLTVVVQTPGVSQFFGCTPLGPVGWAIAGTSASLATTTSVVVSRLYPVADNKEMSMSPTETAEPEVVEEQHEKTAEEPVEEAREGGRKLGRAARVVLSETAYATIGVGGVAVDLVRRTPDALRKLNHGAASGVKTVGSQVVRGLIGLSHRGHTMLGSAPPSVQREAPPADEPEQPEQAEPTYQAEPAQAEQAWDETPPPPEPVG